MYGSILSLTLGLDGMGGKPHAPATLHPGKTQCTLYRRLGGSQDRSGRVRKISPPPGSDSRTVASRYIGPRCHVVRCQITNVSEGKTAPIFRAEKYTTLRMSGLRVAYHCTLKMEAVCSSERLMLL